MTLDDLVTAPATQAVTGTDTTTTWRTPGLELTFTHADAPAALTGVRTVAGITVDLGVGVPAVEVLVAGRGRTLVGSRLVQSEVGASLRVVHVAEGPDGGLEIVQESPDGLRVVLRLRSAGQTAWTATTTVTNESTDTVVLQSVTSWVQVLGTAAGHDAGADGWDLLDGRNDWLGEGRWTRRPVRDELPALSEHLTGHTPRSGARRTAQGTWSTGGTLPLGGALSPRRDLAWLWQVEHNGPWRWEVGEHIADAFVALSGPTDDDHQWSQPLEPGRSFTTVPATIALGETRDAAAAVLTRHRRATRRPHLDDAAPAIVFNDYMNTLNGDPTTEKLLPLVEAAASVGAEVFCIDAGWYDDGGDWWPSVGAWQPSTVRFAGGLAEVTDRIRALGMVPGLWLEPESVGVLSPVASSLPDSAFLQRDGHRVQEQDRLHLDLRHPAARGHLDEVVDRLVRDFGVGYFKLDYNTDPGPGTDLDAPSVGAGLLGHSRAVQDWLDGVLDRHPTLVLEACSSGAMRSDQAILSRVQAQSTSDQQDFLRYPPIAAAAPLMMLPEQAASWAYPQSSMTDEEAAFCLVTSMLGRYFVSGYLNTMDDARLGLVRDAVDAARSLRPDIVRSVPLWPSGLPGWDDRWVSLALVADDRTHVSIWDRHEDAGDIVLKLPHLRGCDIAVDVVFPRQLDAWPTRWDAMTGTLTVRSTAGTVGARTVTLTTRS